MNGDYKSFLSFPEPSQTSSQEFRGSKFLSTAHSETPFGLRPHSVSERETLSYPDCRPTFGLINRFSEDIDIVVYRDDLGF